MYDVYAKLRDARGLSDYRVSKDTGIGSATFTDMKTPGYIPKYATIKKLADYFDVTVDYLMTGKDTEKTSESGTSYYFDDETAAAAQALFENRDLRVLFDAARDARPEDLRMATDLLKRFKETNPDG